MQQWIWAYLFLVENAHCAIKLIFVVLFTVPLNISFTWRHPQCRYNPANSDLQLTLKATY